MLELPTPSVVFVILTQLGKNEGIFPPPSPRRAKITTLLSATPIDMLSCARRKTKKSHLIRKGLCVLCIKLNVTLVGDSLGRCVVIVFLPLTCLFDTFAFLKHICCPYVLLAF